MGKISFDGLLLAKGSLMLDPSIRLLSTRNLFVFLGGVFGGLRLLRKWLFFAWAAALGNILTLDNLRKRQIIVINRCCMCKKNEESVDHLLLHYEVACVLWNAIFGCFRLSWVMPRRVVDLFACWWMGGRSRSAVVWKMVPCCLLWCLWKERNDRQFKDKERSMEELMSFFFYSLYSWTAAFLAPLVISYNNFLVLFSSS
jgi:hypothetical protein